MVNSNFNYSFYCLLIKVYPDELRISQDLYICIYILMTTCRKMSNLKSCENDMSHKRFKWMMGTHGKFMHN